MSLEVLKGNCWLPEPSWANFQKHTPSLPSDFDVLSHTGDAVQLVKTAATKVVDTVSETAAKFVPRRDSDPAQSSGRDEIPQGWRDSRGLWPGSTEGRGRDRKLSRRRESEFSDLFGGGLLGRGMGRFMQSASETFPPNSRFCWRLSWCGISSLLLQQTYCILLWFPRKWW